MECHTLMSVKRGFKTASTISQLLISLLFGGFLWLLHAAHGLKLKFEYKIIWLLLGPFWPAGGDICDNVFDHVKK